MGVMQVKLRSNYQVQVSKRVQVSRMMLTPLKAACVLSNDWIISPRTSRAWYASSCVTADTECSMSTSLSLARNHLSCLRAIAVTHY
jgi:hypothetical protein